MSAAGEAQRFRPQATRLPPQVHVFVRDWLSSNNVLLKSRDGHVLIDSGYSTHAPLTLALLASERGLDGAPLALVANTHCHSDHVGGNAAIARRYGCPIAVPEAEAPSVRRWDGKALLHDYCDHRVERFAVDHEIAAGSRHLRGEGRPLSRSQRDVLSAAARKARRDARPRARAIRSGKARRRRSRADPDVIR